MDNQVYPLINQKHREALAIVKIVISVIGDKMDDIVKIDCLNLIESLAKEGRSQAEIGLLLGFGGADAKGWFRRLRRKYSEVEEAYQTGLAVADAHLMKTAYERAIGYEFTEEEIEYESIGNGDFDENGNPVIIEIPKKRVVKRKHKPADASLLRFLITNRMVEFQDKKKVEVEERKVKQTESEVIDNFAGKLMTKLGLEELEVEDIEFEEGK